MNLRFFTIELERGGARDRSRNSGPRAVESSPRGRLRSISLAISAALFAIAAGCGGWLLAGGDPSGLALPGWLAVVTPAVAAQGDNQAQLDVISEPLRATVLLDGRERGTTPLALLVAQGIHTLVLKHPDAIDDQRQISVASDTRINLSMWLRRPPAVLLKPAYPGASIANVAFLEDGRLAVSMALPSAATIAGASALLEPWIYDPARGGLAQFATQGPSPRAAKLALSPDGYHLAYLEPEGSAPYEAGARARLTEVWVASADTTASPVRVFALPSVAVSSGSRAASSGDIEEIHDLTWTPDNAHLLITVRLATVTSGYAPAPRSRLLLVDAFSEQLAPPVDLMTLPAEVVAGSYVWAPDGEWVAFLTQAQSGSGNNFIGLCAVDTTAGGAIAGFRYVADLGHSTDPTGPLPVAAVAWSPTGDGRLAYSASTPRVTVSNPLGLPTTSGGEPVLFVARPAGQGLTAEEGQRLGSATGLIAPAWPSAAELGEAGLIALARSDKGSRPLVMLGVDPISGAPQNLDVVLPSTVGGSGVVAVRWDLGHGRVLVLARHDNSSSGLLDYWLVQLQAQVFGD